MYIGLSNGIVITAHVDKIYCISPADDFLIADNFNIHYTLNGGYLYHTDRVSYN